MRTLSHPNGISVVGPHATILGGITFPTAAPSSEPARPPTLEAALFFPFLFLYIFISFVAGRKGRPITIFLERERAGEDSRGEKPREGARGPASAPRTRVRPTLHEGKRLARSGLTNLSGTKNPKNTHQNVPLSGEMRMRPGLDQKKKYHGKKMGGTRWKRVKRWDQKSRRVAMAAQAARMGPMLRRPPHK